MARYGLSKTDRRKWISTSPLPPVADCGEKYVITNSRVFPCLAQMRPKRRALVLCSLPFHLHRHCQSLNSACMPLSALGTEPIACRPFRLKLEDSFQGV